MVKLLTRKKYYRYQEEVLGTMARTSACISGFSKGPRTCGKIQCSGPCSLHMCQAPIMLAHMPRPHEAMAAPVEVPGAQGRATFLSAARNQERRRAWQASQESKLQPLPSCDACTPPSPEEVQSWAQSFDKLMHSPAGRSVFRAFLRTEYSEENMLFWLACEELKAEANQHVVDEKARLIYEDYVSILSPKEVSLDSRVREGINRKMQEPSAHTFDDAQLQIYTLMHRDSYPRFLSSPAYRTLLLRGSPQSSSEA
ncbi:regulator of G-protein signaling 19 isoform X1 [Marmota monax]|uniref:regulator of G-protein signaling 19 isoform X1 n=1 Tax=Marmota monax TaxID=9995 RepID=UPI001EAFB0AA|nr:regulator of G-protein signaling 19 isoform X1 [Marmota monax]XP_058431395.1 regulator of G-protein signaling 19 isoform X1 [Marmota monax]